MSIIQDCIVLCIFNAHNPDKRKIKTSEITSNGSSSWLVGGVMIGTWNLWSRSRGFVSRLGCYQVADTSICDRKLSRYITNTNDNSAFYPSGVNISSTRCLAEVKAGQIHLCRVAGNTVWSHMAGDAL